MDSAASPGSERAAAPAELEPEAFRALIQRGLDWERACWDSLFSAPTTLTVSGLDLFAHNRASGVLAALAGDVVMVRQSVRGDLNAEARWLLPEPAARALLATLLPQNGLLDLLTESDRSALCELGNMVITSAIVALSMELDLDLETRPPELEIDHSVAVLATSAKGPVLLYRVRFAVAGRALDSHVALVMDEESGARLTRRSAPGGSALEALKSEAASK